jgi:hypothetical protein
VLGDDDVEIMLLSISRPKVMTMWRNRRSQSLATTSFSAAAQRA